MSKIINWEDKLPIFPWDKLGEIKKIAAKNFTSVVNLSVGSPIDPVPKIVLKAVNSAAEVAGYPTVAGDSELFITAVRALRRRYKINFPFKLGNFLPTIGSKEAIALLPFMLGFNKINIAIPELAYPTYSIAANLTDSRITAVTPESDFTNFDLIYLNTPANPTGRILAVSELRKILAQARSVGAIVVCDECYLSMAWDRPAVSILSGEVNSDDLSNIIAVHSLSKISNLASYRAGFLMGDSKLISRLLFFRKHAGFMVPYLVQRAMIAALSDDSHVNEQLQIYKARRENLLKIFETNGFKIADSQGGLYLWITRGENCWDTVKWFASKGIIVAPGEFYGTKGIKYVRVAFTASDNDIDLVMKRLSK